MESQFANGGEMKNALRYCLGVIGGGFIWGGVRTALENQHRYAGGWTVDVEAWGTVIAFGCVLLLVAWALRDKSVGEVARAVEKPGD
jgi:hypothetical protein